MKSQNLNEDSRGGGVAATIRLFTVQTFASRFSFKFIVITPENNWIWFAFFLV